MIQIDITSFCNINCHFCGRNQEYLDGIIPLNTQMSWDMYTHIMQAVSDYLDKVHLEKNVLLTGAGEPLLWKHYKEGVLFAKKLGFKVKLITNGVLLKGDMLDFVLDNIDYGLKVSLNAATPDTYRAVCGYSKPEEVFHNCLTAIRKIRERPSFPRPFVIGLVETDRNRHEVELFKMMWSKYSDVVAARVIRDQFEDRQDIPHANLNGSCNRVKPNFFKILQNGDVMPCCRIRLYPVGNILEQTMEEIVNGPVYTAFDMLNKASKLGGIYECNVKCLHVKNKALESKAGAA